MHDSGARGDQRPAAALARMDATLRGIIAAKRSGISRFIRQAHIVHVYPTTLLALFHDRIYWFRILPEGARRFSLKTLELVPPATATADGFADTIEVEKGLLSAETTSPSPPSIRPTVTRPSARRNQGARRASPAVELGRHFDPRCVFGR